ncbi:TIGR03943 family protein [Moorena sp. SIO3I8]|uniref:TIGR03943 family putative permease subunit n=1 Tax=unclassified Moorena TaxID=2683338 RepID=UPI0025E8BB4D|nr:TIGR03943 family protein [Moorena sp. SIO3I8]
MNPSNHSGRLSRKSSYRRNWSIPLSEVISLALWGVLLLKSWLTGELSLLIHPNYFSLVVITGIILLLISGLRLSQLLKLERKHRLGKAVTRPAVQHTTLFPPSWSSGFLIATAMVGLIVTPKAFTSQTALHRGIADSPTITRSQPQSFRSASNPEKRTLIEWIKLLNVYPEPDAYTGQKVKVDGFVVIAPNLPPDHLLISRFVITCCAADAYPLGLPVKINENRNDYPSDTWIEVEGQMITETLDDRRQLVIEASGIKKIPEPKNPYYY